MSFMGVLASASPTEILLALAVFCVLLMVLQSFQKQVPQGPKKIPGPRNFPVIGNLLEVGRNPHLSLTRMSQTYGDVMMIHIGTRPVLVLSGVETIKQALVRQGEDFMGRPDLYSFSQVIDGQSLTFSTDSGEVWLARRKLAQNALKTFSTSTIPTSSTSLLEDHISKEVNYLISKLLEVMLAKNCLEPYRYVVVSVANVVCAMCFGKRFSHEDQEFLDIVNISEEFVETAASGNPADFIPALRYLPGNGMKKFKRFNNQITRFLRNLVNDHYKSFRKDNVRDITDSLIAHSQEEKVDQKVKIKLPTEKIVNLVNDIFGAGFDTTTTALSWCLMYLIVYPKIQEKIQEELDERIGRERKPRLSDRSLLPYTEAFILEMFRHSSFLPFTIPHCTTRDTVFNGYFLPKDLCVFINQWQVNHDENLWEDPSSFIPERFLTADRKELNKDESDKILLFGLGKRRCLGETIARKQVFLFLTMLLQELQFSVPDGVTVDMTPIYGLSMKHKRCEHVQVKQRFPKRMEG